MRLGFFLFLVVCFMAVPLGASCVNTRILASLSEQIGEVASMAAIEGMIPGAEQLPSALPRDGKQGQFDLVYRGPDGTIYIVEAFPTNRPGNDPLIGPFWDDFDANRVKIRSLYADTAPKIRSPHSGLNKLRNDRILQ